MDLYAAAESELVTIERDLIALQKRRDELRAFVDLGARLFIEGGPSSPRVNGHSTFIQGHFPSPASTAKDAITEAVRSYLSLGIPLSTRTLVDMLEAGGIEIPGKDKNNTVSVILSKSRMFKNDRKQGWSLPDQNEEEAPQGGDTPAGPDVESQPVPGEGQPERQPADLA